MSNPQSNGSESGPLPEISTSESSKILAVLKDIASRDAVPGVAVWCLRCLKHSDEEVRQWASEAIAESVMPSSDETSDLIDFSNKLTQRWQENASDEASVGTDPLFFTVKILGRLDTSDAETRRSVHEALSQIASLESPSESSPLYNAVQRAKRESERLG